MYGTLNVTTSFEVLIDTLPHEVVGIKKISMNFDDWLKVYKKNHFAILFYAE